jgi:D-alanine transaminase
MALDLNPGRAPPGRVAYVDGRYVRHGEAAVHVEDRGLQFADAVYEVVGVAGGKLTDEAPHIERLERSLREIGMAMPVTPSALRAILREVVRKNRLKDGIVYLQVTRGAATRDHAIPKSIVPTLIVTAKRVSPPTVEARRMNGIAVVTVPENRWARCDIKSTGLLPNVLAKSTAREKGGYEAWFVDADAFVTEGSSTNAWIVDSAGRAVTRSLADNILPGVTRALVFEAAREAGIEIAERPFTLEEAYAATEAFVTSATGGVMPVVTIDGRTIGEGIPGPVAAKMQSLYAGLSLRMRQ